MSRFAIQLIIFIINLLFLFFGAIILDCGIMFGIIIIITTVFWCSIACKQIVDRRKKNNQVDGSRRPKKDIIHLPLIIGFIIFMWVIYSSLCLTSYKSRSPDSAANADIKSAYTVAYSFWVDHPDDIVTIDLLKKFGFKPSENVHLTIISGEPSDFAMQSSHIKGTKIYSINRDGEITSRIKNEY